MGLFRVRGRLTGPTGRSEDAELLVDTGATLLVVPRSLAERLALATGRTQRVVIAGGQRPSGLSPRFGSRWTARRSPRHASSPPMAHLFWAPWRSKVSSSVWILSRSA